MSEEVVVRRARPSDDPAVLDLAARTLGWTADARDREFFAWKHDQNPVGRSAAWVAEARGTVVGFRTMHRWHFRSAAGDHVEMVRAVDTATDPAYQGKGIFRRLTLRAVDELTNDEVGAVFNTPNASSRPGYLKMGWSIVGRPTLWVHPGTPAAAIRMLRARVPAEKWSEPVELGEPAVSALDELEDGSIPARPTKGRIGPVRTSAWLRWRYSFEPLNYRAVEVRGGCAIVRVRRRGPLREVALCEWLSDQTDPRAVRALARTAGDYVVGLGHGHGVRQGLVPLPRQGPTVTWRPLARPGVPTLSELDVGLGDLELF